MHEQRFPLFLGWRAFRLLAIVPAWVLCAAALCLTVYLVGPDLPYGDTLRLVGYVGLLLAVCMCVSPFALIGVGGYVVRSFRRALAVRACDVVLGREGLRVLGGQAHGFSASWKSLAQPGGVRWDKSGLWLRGGEKYCLQVPIPPDPEESASLEALYATVASAAAASTGPAGAAPRRAPPGTLLCSHCGAPQAPVEAAEVRCPHCDTPNPVPAELGAKLRAMREVARQRAADDTLAAALVRQRSARVANLVAFLGGLLMLAATVVTVFAAAMCAFEDGHEAGLPRGGGFGIAAAGAGLALLGTVRFILANRRALRLLCVGFSAVAPSREGEPAACRECMGPLPVLGPGEAVAHCVFCGAANVMAADLRLEAAIVSRFAGATKDPHELLTVCARGRRRGQLWAGLGLAMVIGGALWLVRQNRAVPLRGIDQAVELAFDDTQRSTIGGTLMPAAAATQVERVRDLGKVRVWLTPDGQGGVSTVDPNATLAKLPFSRAWYADTVVMDAVTDAHGTIYATMRASEQGHLHVRRIAPDGSTQVVLDDAREPMPSPDGKKLAVVKLWGETFHLIVANADGSQARLLVRGRGHDAFPVWSPDSQRIAFLTRTIRDPIQFTVRYGSSDLWVIRADGGGAEQLTRGAPLEMVRPVWTEQGVWVLARGWTSKSFVTVLWRVVPRDGGAG